MTPKWAVRMGFADVLTFLTNVTAGSSLQYTVPILKSTHLPTRVVVLPETPWIVLTR